MSFFGREYLEAGRGWDPFNITEDAELGARLARCGYEVGVISRPTLEDAPTRIDIWLRQRTRWLKGWTHTWLVEMRNPAEFLREVGVQRFLVFQALVVGIIASSLIYPLMLLWIGYGLVHVVLGETASLDYAVMAINCMNVAMGFLSRDGLGKGPGKAISAPVMRWLPLYWLFTSAAAWRALATSGSAIPLGEDIAQAVRSIASDDERSSRSSTPSEELVARADDERILIADHVEVSPLVRQAQENSPDDGDACTPLVVGPDNRPRRVGRVGASQHFVARLGVVIPSFCAFYVDGRELPVLQRAVPAVVKPLQLHELTDIEPELEEVNAVRDNKAFKSRHFFQKGFMLFGRAKSEYLLDARPVVPGAIERDELAGCWEMRDISLEIPLPTLGLARFWQSDVAGGARVHVLAEREDRAAFAGSITPLKQAYDTIAGVLKPVLHLDELNLQLLNRLRIFIAGQFVAIGISPRCEIAVIDPVWQLGVVDVVSAFLAVDLEFECGVSRYRFVGILFRIFTHSNRPQLTQWHVIERALYRPEPKKDAGPGV
jgi:hypothetical protein